jgi:hypothetical protein
MSPFAPKGDRSLRVIVAEMVAERSPGDLITYDELGTALDLDPDERRDQIRQAVSAARPLILADHKRALISDRGKGYRIAWASEFAGLAQEHRRKADRQIGKALDIVRNVNEKELSPEELKRHRAVAMVITNLHARMTSAESRLQQLEEAVFGSAPPVIQGHVEHDELT